MGGSGSACYLALQPRGYPLWRIRLTPRISQCDGGENYNQFAANGQDADGPDGRDGGNTTLLSASEEATWESLSGCISCCIVVAQQTVNTSRHAPATKAAVTSEGTGTGTDSGMARANNTTE